MDIGEFEAVMEALHVLDEKYELGFPFDPDVEVIESTSQTGKAEISGLGFLGKWLFSTDGDNQFEFTPKELIELSETLPEIEFDEVEAAFITKNECCICVQEVDVEHTSSYLMTFRTNYQDKFDVCLSEGSQLQALGTGQYFLKKYRAKHLVQPTLTVFVLAKAKDASKKAMLEAAKVFLFELSTTHGIQFQRVPPYLYYDEEEGHVQLTKVNQIRPLIDYSEALQLFLDAEAAGSIDQEILGYYKVLEYFGPAASKMDSHDKLAHLLSDPRALNPDSKILDQILAVNYDFKNARDQQQLRLVFERCCSLHFMSEFPEFESRYGLATDKKTPRILADAYYATRNEVVHAKANYTSKGDEIPESMRVDGVKMLRRLADQVIRWGSRQPNHIWASG